MDASTRKRKESKGRSDHSVLTVNGRVVIGRRHYHSPIEGTSTPMDALLDAAEATVSLGVREICCRMNADGRSFERTAANLKRAAQLTLSGETLRKIVESDGKLALQLTESGELAPDWTAGQCVGPEGKSVVYLSSDGFTAPTITEAEKKSRRDKAVKNRKARWRSGLRPPRPLPRRKTGTNERYKEFKIVMFYDHTMDHRVISVTNKNCDEAGRLMRRDAGRIGFGAADFRVGNIDGGPWIIGQIVKRHLPMTATGLDFFHFGQNVHKARRVIFGEEDKAGNDKVADLLHTAKHEGFQPFWEKTLQMRKEECRSKSKREAADGLLNYVSERREMILYPEFLAHGWQIGSGPIESQCRVVPDRVKGPGKRWDRDTAEAVMEFEALHQSGQWPAFWKAALAHEYQMN